MKIITCLLELEGKKCPELSSDDWDELEDPCQGCSNHCFKKINDEDLVKQIGTG